MTLTLNLPEQIEQAYRIVAQSKGVSIDALVSDLLLLHVPVVESQEQVVSSEPHLIEEFGISVLRTGYPMELSVINETLDLIRRERDLVALGQF